MAKRVPLRTVPEFKRELEKVVNVFDPWARDPRQKLFAPVGATVRRRVRHNLPKKISLDILLLKL